MRKILKIVVTSMVCICLVGCGGSKERLALDQKQVYEQDQVSLQFRSMNITNEIVPSNQNNECYTIRGEADQIIVDTTFYVENKSKEDIKIKDVVKLKYENEDEESFTYTVAYGIETNAYDDIQSSDVISKDSKGVLHYMLFFKEKEWKQMQKKEHPELNITIFDTDYVLAMKKQAVNCRSIVSNQAVELQKQVIQLVDIKNEAQVKPLKESHNSNWYGGVNPKHTFVYAHLRVENTSDQDFDFKKQIGCYFKEQESISTPWIIFLSDDGSQFMNDENTIIPAHKTKDIFVMKEVEVSENASYSFYITSQGIPYELIKK